MCGRGLRIVSPIQSMSILFSHKANSGYFSKPYLGEALHFPPRPGLFSSHFNTNSLIFSSSMRLFIAHLQESQNVQYPFSGNMVYISSKTPRKIFRFHFHQTSCFIWNTHPWMTC
uniref:Uncharacterized protein n=1 Tax=Sphaerodactylus townsendi TaxID=933632 RepID=A0ACB8EE15_9SAUR